MSGGSGGGGGGEMIGLALDHAIMAAHHHREGELEAMEYELGIAAGLLVVAVRQEVRERLKEEKARAEG